MPVLYILNAYPTAGSLNLTIRNFFYFLSSQVQIMFIYIYTCISMFNVFRITRIQIEVILVYYSIIVFVKEKKKYIPTIYLFFFLLHNHFISKNCLIYRITSELKLTLL